jgi:ubiquinone/menaquinone biosynthesis C-methylase UbiE
MKEKSKGISLDYASTYYDIITPAEKSQFRRKQIGLINLREGERVLEVGCGTGTLSVLAKLAVGETGAVEGIDIAPKMIAKARKKAEKAFLEINFQVASIDRLPYPDTHFDVVMSSMMLHHLPVEIKKSGLREVRRVLKKEGRFFLSDFCSPHGITVPLMYLMLIWTSSTRYQLFGKLPGLVKEAGFRHVNLEKKGFFLEYYMITK